MWGSALRACPGWFLCPAGTSLLPAPVGAQPFCTPTGDRARHVAFGGPIEAQPCPFTPRLPPGPHKSLWASTSIICPSSKKPFPPSACLPPIPPFLVSPSPPSLHLSLMSSSSISPVSPSFILPSLLHPSIFHPAVSL